MYVKERKELGIIVIVDRVCKGIGESCDGLRWGVCEGL